MSSPAPPPLPWPPLPPPSPRGLDGAPRWSLVPVLGASIVAKPRRAQRHLRQMTHRLRRAHYIATGQAWKRCMSRRKGCRLVQGHHERAFNKPCGLNSTTQASPGQLKGIWLQAGLFCPLICSVGGPAQEASLPLSTSQQSQPADLPGLSTPLRP